jgi:hypothetical protein
MLQRAGGDTGAEGAGGGVGNRIDNKDAKAQRQWNEDFFWPFVALLREKVSFGLHRMN